MNFPSMSILFLSNNRNLTSRVGMDGSTAPFLGLDYSIHNHCAKDERDALSLLVVRELRAEDSHSADSQTSSQLTLRYSILI
jgi:hypothetical protein